MTHDKVAKILEHTSYLRMLQPFPQVYPVQREIDPLYDCSATGHCLIANLHCDGNQFTCIPTGLNKVTHNIVAKYSKDIVCCCNLCFFETEISL